MLTLTSPIETPWHRWPAGVKLAALCAVTLGLFALQSPLPLALSLAAIAALYLPGGLPFLRLGARLLWPLWPFVAIVGLWHFWTGDPQGGLAVILRLLAAVAAANLVTMTTRLSDMIAVIERMAGPLARLGLPPRTLALAIALVIRFIPVLSDRLTQISESWRARATRRPGWRILTPAALAALDDADRVAEALRARGGAG